MAAVVIAIPHWGAWRRVPPAPSPFQLGAAAPRYSFRGLGAVSVTLTPGLQQVANVIITQENANPAYNNPGNLMYAGQPGATRGPGGLAVFDTYANGLQALYAQITLDANRGETISDFTAKYAPASIAGNDPVLYANNIAGALGISPDSPLMNALTGGASPGVPLPPGLVDSFAPSFDVASMFGGLDPMAIGALSLLAAVVVLGVFRR